MSGWNNKKQKRAHMTYLRLLEIIKNAITPSNS